MQWPNWKSFIVGAVTALLAVFLVSNRQHLGVRGGVNGHSPDGRFTLLALTSRTCPAAGGEYLIQLIDKESGSVVRHVELSFARGEATVPLRGGCGRVHWDSQSRYADLFAAGVPILRLWVPKTVASQSQHEGETEDRTDGKNEESRTSR